MYLHNMLHLQLLLNVFVLLTKHFYRTALFRISNYAICAVGS